LAQVESCSTCHDGAGEAHQAIYDSVVDTSGLTLTFGTVTSADDGSGGYDVTVPITITKDGQPYVDTAGLPGLNQKRFYALEYYSQNRQYLNSCSLGTITPTDAQSGEYDVTGNCDYPPEDPIGDGDQTADGSHVYGYLADDPVVQHEGGTGAEIPAGSHVHLYDSVVNTGVGFGTGDVSDQDAYVSLASSEGCIKCHGEATDEGYLKHGYRAAAVDGLADFAACKSCHYDDRGGNHEEWQYMVDQPLNWATAALDRTDVRTLYAYTANIMNDTHMSHAMEFPFPMSMSNCVTCHEGKLSPGVLDNSYFQAVTCKSCHAVQGTDAWPDEKYEQSHRAPPMDYLFAAAGVENLLPHTTLQDPSPADCTVCHGAGTAPPFDAYHTGYDVRVSDDTGQRYADTYTASIGAITLTGDSLRIEYGTSDPAMSAEVLVSFYGWGSKNFLVASHERDGSTLCTGRGGDPAGCRYEYVSGDTNPLFTEDPASAPGAWIVTADLAAFQAVKTDDIPTLIAMCPTTSKVKTRS
jgi:hypothetical protein